VEQDSQPVWDAPPDGPAIDHEPTRLALRSYRRRSVAIVAIELGAIIVVLPLLGVTDQNHGAAFAMVAVLFVLVVLGLIPMVFGLVLLFNSRRIGRTLRQHPWVSWPAQFKFVPWGEGAVEALFLGVDLTQVLTVHTGLSRRHKRLTGLSEIWLAGTPEAGGVVSPPGGALVISARRPAGRLEHELIEHRPVNNPGSPPDRESGDLT
jgi:hypothetical protein